MGQTLHGAALRAAVLETRQKSRNRSQLPRRGRSAEKRKRLPYAHDQCFAHIFIQIFPTVEKGTCSPDGWFCTAQHRVACISSKVIFQPYILILQLFVFM